MKRREVITLLGGSAAMWPLVAHSQQRDRMRKIGVLYILAPGDVEAHARSEVLERTLRQLGWAVGRNLQIDYRLAAGHPDRLREYAAELVALAPDVIVTAGSLTIAPLLQATRTIPIVFVNITDPVGAGFVQSLARPGGNATGFTNFEYSMSGKWVELLKQIAPRATRVAVLRDSSGPAGLGQFGAIQAVAQSLGVELTPVGVRDADEIERGVAPFARSADAGLIVTSGGVAFRRDFIIRLASRLKLPAVYPFRYFAVDGGLISYGPDTRDPIRRAAGYVDRIHNGDQMCASQRTDAMCQEATYAEQTPPLFKGEKPADLPVQQSTKFELVINLKTARALGLEVPPSLLARADEVIELKA